MRRADGLAGGPASGRKSRLLLAFLLIALSGAAGPGVSVAQEFDFLASIHAEPLPFQEIRISDSLVVYFHQRMLGDAVVEKDYIVYQFEIETGRLIERRSHWREDLPVSLPPVRVTATEALGIAGKGAEWARLLLVSPESDIVTIRPVPQNPCWLVKSVADGGASLTLVDAANGEVAGEAIAPPAAGSSLTGPIYFRPCSDAWHAWAENAASWFRSMGYPTQVIVWPAQNDVMERVQSNDILVFYELAHGDFLSFQSGCRDGETAEYTTSEDVRDWIAGSYKKLFTFLGSCDGQCSASSNSFSYEFRKGSRENTVTIGYCGMSEPQCDICWSYSLEWQNRLFWYVALGWPVRQAFDRANADYPACSGENHCMRFAGDPELAIAQAEGACCLGSVCSILSTDDCVASGGEWFPGIAGCEPDPCREYACCLGSNCLSLNPFDCMRAEGMLFTELDACAPSTCAPGACCHEAICEETIEGACLPAGGVWHAGVLCEPDPCASSSAPGPIENLSHGEALDLAGDAQTPRLVILDPIAHGSSPRRIQAFLPAVRDGEESAPARPGDSRSAQSGSIPAVRLTIHDVMGRLVRCLADGPLPPGLHEWQWDGRNARGEAVRTGVYFCRLTASGRESIAELLVVR